MISVRAAFACGTTPGMLRNACVAPGCSASRAGVPASRSRSAYRRPLAGEPMVGPDVAALVKVVLAHFGD